MKRIVFTLILVGILIAIGVVFYLYNKPHRNVESEKASITLKAEDLFNNYTQNEKQSDSIYLNKVLEVEGDINEMDVDQKGEKMLILKEEDDMFGVVCTIDESDEENKNKAASLKIGDHVVLKGICSGFDTEVKLNKCVIIQNLGKKQAAL